jgi:hypothetical protein
MLPRSDHIPGVEVGDRRWREVAVVGGDCLPSGKVVVREEESCKVDLLVEEEEMTVGRRPRETVVMMRTMQRRYLNGNFAQCPWVEEAAVRARRSVCLHLRNSRRRDLRERGVRLKARQQWEIDSWPR